MSTSTHQYAASPKFVTSCASLTQLIHMAISEINSLYRFMFNSSYYYRWVSNTMPKTLNPLKLHKVRCSPNLLYDTAKEDSPNAREWRVNSLQKQSFIDIHTWVRLLHRLTSCRLCFWLIQGVLPVCHCQLLLEQQPGLVWAQSPWGEETQRQSSMLQAPGLELSLLENPPVRHISNKLSTTASSQLTNIKTSMLPQILWQWQ